MTSSTPQPSPPSIVSVSDDSASSESPPEPQVEGPSGNGEVESREKKPETDSKFENTNIKEDIEKYMKLEAEYTRYLNAKYFSKKDIFGGIIFDEKTAINHATIKSSRWHGTRSYADPLLAFEEQINNCPTSASRFPTSFSNGKYSAKN